MDRVCSCCKKVIVAGECYAEILRRNGGFLCQDCFDEMFDLNDPDDDGED